ncbi:MAG: hypothetical protein LBJ73_03340 [Rickettsiales bacterium]|nr:hypothetical protein [Rickettsiales bacterium]
MKPIYFLSLVACVLLAGCNDMYIKPGTLDARDTFYFNPGGGMMARHVKESMDRRGYDVRIGKRLTKKTMGTREGGVINIDEYKVENVKYVVNISETAESLWTPLYIPWCVFNGLWWVNFNMSIDDQTNGRELMTWHGSGCAGSSLRKLNRALDEMEIKNADSSGESSGNLIKK